MQKSKDSRGGFTLIELMIVILIIVFLMLGIYAPYSYQQHKASVKFAAKEISQSLSDTRNMAIHGRTLEEGNAHIGLFIKKRDTLEYRAYPLTATGSADGEVIQEKVLSRGIRIDEDMLGIEYFFETISGDVQKRIHQGDGLEVEELGAIEEIPLSFKDSTSEQLQKTIRYFTDSHVSDY